ncbi:uncharacterized protein LOC118459298 isoform X1 [Anopheles albimanus]|uniref:GCN5-related N-acetyltransferase Rv2170-like domain-containing protein n=1 Tax=Anopheles albimanus TaxID=7167 RepID=A0A3F2YQ89_ANOAL|nr:uncharacterized protein LOC118459298 isoform X1 [Anopheles albimanus]XP_035778439.1 uncharacterized protein LOC118459298 isoform X1 [Anopheles albimanus]
MAGNDRLVEISYVYWVELRDIFRCDWPKHEFAYYLLANYIRWISVDPSQSEVIKIYSLNGSWRSNQTFLLRDGFEIYFSTTTNESTCGTLARLLALVDWEVMAEVSMDFQERHQSVIEHITNDRKLTVSSSNVANYYFLEQKQALQISSPTLPKGFVFGRLDGSHLDYIYNQWPLKDHISYEAGHGLLERLIRLNESVGLFDIHGHLVSWCLSDQTGAHSDLQTAATHYRRGFGRMVVIELAKLLARLGSDSKAYVLSSNERSIKLFESIGFQKLENLRWIVIKGVEDGIARTC